MYAYLCSRSSHLPWLIDKALPANVTVCSKNRWTNRKNAVDNTHSHRCKKIRGKNLLLTSTMGGCPLSPTFKWFFFNSYATNLDLVPAGTGMLTVTSCNVWVQEYFSRSKPFPALGSDKEDFLIMSAHNHLAF